MKIQQVWLCAVLLIILLLFAARMAGLSTGPAIPMLR
jgi:thiol:disulfide interchange protein